MNDIDTEVLGALVYDEFALGWGLCLSECERVAEFVAEKLGEMFTREDLARAFDEGFEQGWAYRATNRTDDPDNPYTKEEQ